MADASLPDMTGAQQTRDRNRRDDADDRHDDQQLDQRKAFVLLQFLHKSSP